MIVVARRRARLSGSRTVRRRVLARLAGIVTAALLLLVVGAAPAVAQPVPAAAPATGPSPTAPAVVALLPLTADRGLALYGQPVAMAVARALRAADVEIIVVSAGASVPTRARLVIDGRIVAAPATSAGAAAGRVVVEARVRDPARGTVVASSASEPTPLTRIDEAATELAARLGPELARALAEQDQRAERDRLAARITAAQPRTRPDATAPAAPPATPAAVPAVRRPVVLVEIASFDVELADEQGRGRMPGAPIIARAAGELAAGLGGQPRIAPDSQALTRASTSALAAAGAELGVIIDVLGLDFDRRGVLLLRARLRVRGYRRSGDLFFDRVVRTDTLVGGRGDRHDTLVAQAAIQAIDVVLPRLRAAAEVAGEPR